MVTSMIKSDLSNLYNKDLIAFGTGHIGKRLIPYLAEIPQIKLHGVTNSRIDTDDRGTFLDTNLPLQRLSTWFRLLPNAAILVSATLKKDVEDIAELCQNIGFQEIIFVDNASIDAIEAIRPTGSPTLQRLCLANEICDTHKAAFSEFKGCHKGQAVAVIGCGPTLNDYSQMKGVPHIGVNASFQKKDLTLDYYFLWRYIPEWRHELKKQKFIKFFGNNRVFGALDVFPEYVIEENNARRYFNGWPNTDIHTNIEYYPLMAFGSVIFAAIHFALYTRPKQILLVGCDCSMDGHFYSPEPYSESEREIGIPIWFQGYRKLKTFVALHYPDTEIISVNPVGLKGMFHDVYTEIYLDTHPEIDRRSCEILNPLKY